jgi:hypothetical protein
MAVNMRLTVEEKEFISLNKEYKFHMKNATRADAPKLERDYYFRMAENTLARANSIPLRKRTKKAVAQESAGEEE